MIIIIITYIYIPPFHNDYKVSTAVYTLVASASIFASMWTYVGCENLLLASHHIQPPQILLKHPPNAGRLSNCCFSQHALHGVHSPCCHMSVVRWGGHMRRPCVYCSCLAGRVSFPTRASVQSLTTANQRRIYTHILSPSSICWDFNTHTYWCTCTQTLSYIQACTH